MAQDASRLALYLCHASSSFGPASLLESPSVLLLVSSLLLFFQGSPIEVRLGDGRPDSEGERKKEANDIDHNRCENDASTVAMLQAPPSLLPPTKPPRRPAPPVLRPAPFSPSSVGEQSVPVVEIGKSRSCAPPRPPAPSIAVNPSPSYTITIPELTTSSDRPYNLRDLLQQTTKLARMCCFISCLPAFKCAFSIAVIELIVGVYYFFDSVNHVAKVIKTDELEFRDGMVTLYFAVFCIASFAGLVMMALAHWKKIPHLLWIRLAFIALYGLFSLVTFVLLLFYLFFGRQMLNQFLVTIVEFIMNEEFDYKEQQELHGDFFKVALVFTVIMFFVISYLGFAMKITLKYYNDLCHDPSFRRVPTEPAVAGGQPAFNPAFGKV
uniref:MARVEL domain-containing protein n=1 Tax=Panagrellus redivivus TaxID=6233 RepID=A0A7E4V9C0_PANRE